MPREAEAKLSPADKARGNLEKLEARLDKAQKKLAESRASTDMFDPEREDKIAANLDALAARIETLAGRVEGTA